MYHIIARVNKGVIARLAVLLQRSLYTRPCINIGRFSIIFILVSSVIACGGGGGYGDGYGQNTVNPNDLDNDGVADTRDNCLPPQSDRNWRAGVDGVRDDDDDGCRTGVLPIEDHFDNDPAEYAARVTALRVIPNTTNATLIWNNPVVFEIERITIHYKVSTANSFENTPIIINSRHNLWGGGRDRSYTIDGLTTNTIYTFEIALILGGADKNYSVSSSSITRFIGPDVDGDGYADADPLENDIDGDGVNNTADLCDSAGFSINWMNGTDRAIDNDGDGCRSDTSPPEDAFDNDATEFSDIDNDTVGDNADVDDNNNGLIEIRNADELNQTRNNLAGTSFKKSTDDVGNSRGCPVGGCNGYELMNDIDLAGFDIMSNVDVTGFNTMADIDKIDLPGYNNWQPIGICTFISGDESICPNVFNATFDGNGFTISSMRIVAESSSNDTDPDTDTDTDLDPDAYGVGLFGAIGPNAVLRNIHIRDGVITDGLYSIGLLVGHAFGDEDNETLIIGSSAQGRIDDIGVTAANMSTSFVGGLVGSAINGKVLSSYMLESEVDGGRSVGGLIGYTFRSNVTSSYVLSSEVTGSMGVGGLIGYTLESYITHSYTREGSVTASVNRSGSLVGNGLNSFIEHSYSTMTVSHPATGILFGFGDTNEVTFSYWDSDIITNGNSANATAKSTNELQTPINSTGIYRKWGNAWCDPDTGDFTTNNTSALYANISGDGNDINDFRVWDFGTNMTYPALTCTQGGTAVQW